MKFSKENDLGMAEEHYMIEPAKVDQAAVDQAARERAENIKRCVIDRENLNVTWEHDQAKRRGEAEAEERRLQAIYLKTFRAGSSAPGNRIEFSVEKVNNGYLIRKNGEIHVIEGNHRNKVMEYLMNLVEGKA